MAAVVAILLLTSPLAVRAIARVTASAVGPDILEEAGFVRDLLTGLGLVAALTGVSVGGLIPGREAVGRQLRVSPISEGLAIVMRIAAPLAVLGASLLAIAGMYLGTLFAGTDKSVVLIVDILAALGSVTIAALAVTHALRAGLLRAGSVATVVLVSWVTSGVVTGVGPWGPIGAAAARMSVIGLPGGIATAAVVVAATSLVWCWLVLGAEQRPARQRDLRSVDLPAGIFGAHYTASLLTLLRRNDIRRHILGVVAGAVLGTGFLVHVTGMATPVTVQLSTSLALFGSAAVLLAAQAYAVDAKWLWGTVPDDVGIRLLATSAAGSTLAAVVHAGVAVALSLLTGNSLGDGLATSFGLAILVGPAVVVGVLFPIRRDGDGDQYVSYAVLTVLAMAWILAVSTVADFGIVVAEVPPLATQIAVGGGLGTTLGLIAAKYLVTNSSGRTST